MAPCAGYCDPNMQDVETFESVKKTQAAKQVFFKVSKNIPSVWIVVACRYSFYKIHVQGSNFIFCTLGH